MATKTTERLHENAIGIDQLPMPQIAAVLADSQVAAAAAVRGAYDGICAGAVAMADTIRTGGCLHYVAAGSSGLMAAADALELGGTFAIPSDQLRIHMAGGMPDSVSMPGDTEDDTDTLERALAQLAAGDTVIAVSASGTTPYTVAAARIAKARRATVIGIANNQGSALLALADYPILLATPPEVLAGSTRMGAGTAQKIALNMLSTLMAVRLGHIHDGQMVNLVADNTKLRMRANGIVMQIADVTAEIADQALGAAGGRVKVAALIAAKGLSRDAAHALLKENDGHLRPALARST